VSEERGVSIIAVVFRLHHHTYRVVRLIEFFLGGRKNFPTQNFRGVEIFWGFGGGGSVFFDDTFLCFFGIFIDWFLGALGLPETTLRSAPRVSWGSRSIGGLYIDSLWFILTFSVFIELVNYHDEISSK